MEKTGTSPPPDEAARFEAQRARIKAARAAAQPWLGIGLASLFAALAAGLLALTHASEALILAMTVFLFVGGVCNAVAGRKSRRYMDAHPLDGDA